MIVVDGLCKTYSVGETQNVALTGVGFRVGPGTVCGIVGPPGAGKSSLVHCLGGIEAPDAGTITVNGDPVSRRDSRSRTRAARRVRVHPRDVELTEERTVAGNIVRGFGRTGLDRVSVRARTARLLDLAGLTRVANATLYPLGAEPRRRLGLAQILAADPSVLVLDDVDMVSGSDGDGDIPTMLARARDELGTTVILATEDTEVVRRVCDHTVVLRAGSVVESGPVLELLSEHHSWTAHTLLGGSRTGHPDGDDALRVGLSGPAPRLAEVVLVGHAAAGTLLSFVVGRFDVSMDVLEGKLVTVAETLVGRFLVALSGNQTRQALDWLVEHGGVVRPVRGPGMAA